MLLKYNFKKFFFFLQTKCIRARKGGSKSPQSQESPSQPKKKSQCSTWDDSRNACMANLRTIGFLPCEHFYGQYRNNVLTEMIFTFFLLQNKLSLMKWQWNIFSNKESKKLLDNNFFFGLIYIDMTLCNVRNYDIGI